MNSESLTLIATKFSRPHVRADLVPRQCLIDQLNQGLDQHHPMTLICAGAGFGKTTIAGVWVEELVAQPSAATTPLVAWLSLDEQDSDLNQFLRYFIAALRTAVPLACTETLKLLEQRSEVRPAILLATLSNDILQLPHHTVVVLDDYHHIRGTAVHNLLDKLLLHWPEPLHLVVISRYTPPLRIAHLRASVGITELRNQDLRFTPDEVAEYVQRMWPVPLSQSGLAVLEQKAEGWIVGLQLASLSLRVAENVEEVMQTLSGSNRQIAEYLTDEVLSRQPSAFQTFLLRTSILEKFNVSLCEAIEANEDPDWDVRAILDWLVHGNLFISPIGNNQEWYRFHPLFRDILRFKLLAQSGQEGVANLHRRAANWFAQRDLLDTAISHALAAEDLNLAADLMEQALCAVLNREDLQTLDRWQRLLPQEFIYNRPGILVIKAWVYHLAWQLSSVAKVIETAEALLEQNDDTAISDEQRQLLCAQIAVLKSQETFNSGHPDLSLAYSQKALELLPPAWTYARGGSMIYLGLSMQAVGDGDAAEKLLVALYEPLPDKTDGYALRLLMTLTYVYTLAGKLMQAEQTARLLLQQATQSELGILWGWAHYLLGVVHYEWNQLDIAGQHFEEIYARRNSVHTLTLRESMTGSALVHLGAGQSEKAGKIVERLSQMDMKANGRLGDTTEAAHAKLLLANGDDEAAARWADTFTTPVTLNLLVLFCLPQLTRVQILLTRNKDCDISQALQILDTLIDFTQHHHNIRWQIKVLAVKALALDIQGNHSDAQTTLKQAIEMARPGGFIRVFVDLGPRLQKMLTTVTLSATYAEFIEQILLAFPGEPTTAAQNGHNHKQHSSPVTFPTTVEMVEPLTSRETQVLTLLREPVSVKEIAFKLNITHATVKRHTINVYGKLGVNTRWDAVAKAEALKLLSPR